MSAKDDYVKKLEESLVRMEAEKEAIVAEYTESLKADGEVTPEQLRKSVDKMLPEALATMQELLTVGENESLRWSIAKFIVASRLSDGKNSQGADAFKELFEQLTKQ